MRYVWVLIALSLPARILLVQRSFWLDEAWVANAALEPAWRDMFYYPWFAQTTPPGFLVLARLTGASRAVPFLAGIAACWVIARLLKQRVGEKAAVAATAVLACNYALILYGSQLKQYSVDVLAASVCLYAILIPPPRAWLMALCVFIPFVSFPSVFFLPALLWRGGWWNALASGASLAVNYFVFILPNRNEAFQASWLGHFLDPVHPFDSLLRMFWSAATLLLPVGSTPGWVLVAIATTAAIAGVCLLRDWRAGLPAFAGLSVSFAGVYPLLDAPRVLLWMLPLLAIGLGVVAERLPRWMVLVGALGAVGGMQFIFFTRPPSNENNREAVASLTGARAVYVHAGVIEQFNYYRRFHDFSTTQILYGATSPPCCMLRVQERAAFPGAESFEAEILNAADKHRRFSIYSPSGADGHFGAFMREKLNKLPGLKPGCPLAESRNFDQVVTTLFVCEDVPSQNAIQ